MDAHGSIFIVNNLLIFRRLKATSKNQRFFEFSKSSKMVESIDPWAPKVTFWIQIHDFWDAFWHSFFHFFRKWPKCETSCARAWALTQTNVWSSGPTSRAPGLGACNFYLSQVTFLRGYIPFNLSQATFSSDNISFDVLQILFKAMLFHLTCRQ